MTGKTNNIIKLKIPNNSDYIHLARLVVSGLGNKMNFDFEDIKKMKYALSEMCLFICENCSDSFIEIEFKQNDKQILFSFNNSCSNNRQELEKFITAFNIDFYMDKIKVGKKISLAKRLPKTALP